MKMFFLVVSFCNRSFEDVKNFLVEYCDERKQSGFFMVPDPLSIFYDALCVGLDRRGNPTSANHNVQPPMTNSGCFTVL